jgi:hypothetical protein
MRTATCLLRTICLFGCVIAAPLPQLAHADQPARATRQSSVFLVWNPLSRDLLDQYRGGFVDISGIKISVGLERMVIVQPLTLTIPDFTSLPLKGSAGAVSVQGPGPIAVTVDPISVNVPAINVQMAQPNPLPTGGVSRLASPVQVSIINPSSTPGTSGHQAAASLASTARAQVTSTAPANVGPQPAAANASLPPSPAQASAPNVASASSSPGGVTVASVIQNGPGNFITSDVLRNLGPGAILVQNTLNDQVIQGLTVINAQVSGLGSLIRSDVFSNLHLTLRGFGR